MRQINSMTLEIGDTDKEFQLSEGAIFHGMQVKQHQILIWLSEITGAPKDHIVTMSNIIEYGSFDDDWVYIGYCSNELYSEDETYHVVAHSSTMNITTVPIIVQYEVGEASIKSVRKPVGRPKKETANAKAKA